MNKKRLYLNLVYSALSLALTLVVGITVIYAWFAGSNNVTAGGIEASSHIEEISVTLEKFDGTAYQDVDLTLSDEMTPGDTFYFRLNLTNKESNDISISATFDDITSGLDLNQLSVINGEICFSYNGSNYAPLYTLDSNSQVLDDAGEVVYEYLDNTLSLKKYFIEEVIYVYDSTYDEATNTNSLVESTKKALTDLSLTSDFIVPANGSAYYYFAISFDTTANSYYSYQNIEIGTIHINHGGAN